jgi:hypothetical protein
MNVRKHLAGLAIFFVILSSSIFINAFLAIPPTPPPLVAVNATPLQFMPSETQPINYRPRLVSLDFIKRQTYTTLIIKRDADQSAPRSLWVTTSFFAPDDAPGRVWTSTVEIRRPFFKSDQTEITATAPCDFCQYYSDAPRAGYFARVYVSTDRPDDSVLSTTQFDRKIADATPVLVQAEKAYY